MSIYSGQGQPISATAKKLIATRFVRSITQGALAVDFALYLNALGWSGQRIGVLLAATGLVSTIGAIFAGAISDRVGRRNLLIGYDIYLMLAGILAASTSNPILLSIAAIAGGFGRGANGTAGPFGPVEQAWLAREVPEPFRSLAYSWNSTAGFLGMGLGALLAASPALFAHTLKGANAYRPLFALVTLSAFIVVLILIRTQDSPQSSPQNLGLNPTESKKSSSELSKEEGKSLWVIAGMNLLNATAIGIAGPLTNYWFFKKFGVGPEVLGPLQAVSFGLTAVASQLNAKIADRVGLTQSVVYSRSLGLLMLVLLPIMPTYPLAFSAYLLRSLFNRGTIGNRNAAIANMVRPQHAGKAFSYASASAQFPMALGPLVSGPLIDAGWFATPFYVAAVLQLGYVSLFNRAFTPRYRTINPEQQNEKLPTPLVDAEPTDEESL